MVDEVFAALGKGGGKFDHPPAVGGLVVEQIDALCQFQRFIAVVRHHNDRHAAVHQLVHPAVQAEFELVIKRGKGFVQQQQVGLAGQRTGQRGTLAHAAGELVRIFAPVGFGQMQALQNGADALAHGAAFRLRRSQQYVFPQRAPRQQARLLKQIAGAAKTLLDQAAVKINQAGNNPQHGGFAAA